MTTWTNDIYKEEVKVGDKTYKNCVLMKGCGCFKGENSAIDCRVCNIPLIFQEEARAYLLSRRQ